MSDLEPFPELIEGRRLNAERINGVDRARLTIGAERDAVVTFRDEVAAFENVLGVYLIDADGTIRDPEIVFARIEHADPLPGLPLVRPGGGPLEPGDAVHLNTLYPAADLEPGQQFGLFVVADGADRNPDFVFDGSGRLEFVNTTTGAPANIADDAAEIALRHVADDGTVRTVEGQVFHTADIDPDRLENNLNPGGAEHVVSGTDATSGAYGVTWMTKPSRRQVLVAIGTAPFAAAWTAPVRISREGQVNLADHHAHLVAHHLTAPFDSNGRDRTFAAAQAVPDVGPAVYGEAGALRKIQTAAGAAAPASLIPQFGDPVRGSFSPVVDWTLVGIHAVLTPAGKVLSYGTDEDGVQTGLFVYDVWDPALGLGANAHTTLPNTTEVDIFCTSQLLLPSGAIELYGGDITVNGQSLNEPNPHITRFQPATNALTRVGQMHRERWYSTATMLLNGQVYIQGGKGGADFPEVRTATGTRLLTGASTAGLSTGYPRNFVRTNGTVFGIAARSMYSVGTTGSGSILRHGTFPASNTGGSSSAVMYAPNKILQVGGGQIPNERASAEARRIDITNPQPQLTKLPSMRHRRHWGNATVLPNGQVFVSGGSAINNSPATDADGNGVSYTSELYTPGNNSWRLGATAVRMRLYHSTNLLLPDATVLTMGGGAPGPQRNLNAEIYYPPYLFDSNGQRATRPVIQSAPTGLKPGAAFTIGTPASASIGGVVLIKTGSVTHSFNFDQRYLPLAFTRPTATTLRATVPALGLTPPGYYLLFILNNGGVPSEAKIIRIVR